MKQKIAASGALIVFFCLMLLAPISYANPVTLNEFTVDSYKLIQQQQTGHPFILLIWSLDCEYCQASLELVAKKQRAHPQLRIITLSTDILTDQTISDMLKSRLASLGLVAQAWAFGDTSPEQLRYSIDQKWHGEMPRSYWFNAQGIRCAVSGVIRSEDVDDFIRIIK